MTQESLPIDALRAELDAALSTHPMLVVQAPTGSGKSTRLPLWLRDHTDQPVLVIEPRRVACCALATYLAKLAGEPVGRSIGYSVRFEDVRSAKTKILFVTPGVALRMAHKLNLGGAFPFGAVLIDEFHERGWEVDLCSAILRHHLKRWGGRLIWTSATLEAEALVERLGAHLMRSEGRTYPVEIEYMAQEVHAPTDEDLERRVARAIRHILNQPGDKGEILVFLPGRGEIAGCEEALGGLAREHGLELVPVHASLPMDRLARAFEARHGVRRVFLATNVAETSVTLPGVTWVVDSGLVRMQQHRAGRVALALVPASQAAMDQRAGRAGRVAPGRCLRLWDRHWPAQASTPPEIVRAELDDVVLQAACCGLEGRAFDEAPWVTQPPPFAVQRARARLERAGALDARGHITARGRVLAALPVSVQESRLMVEAPPELAATVADLVALMQRSGRLMLPTSDARVQEAREVLCEGCRHEVAEALVVLRRGDARRHALHPSGLEEARKLADALRATIGVKQRVTDDTSPLPEDDALACYMARCLPEAAFALRPRVQKERPDAAERPGYAKRRPWANGEVEVGVEAYVPHAAADREHVERHPPTVGVLLQNTWIGDGKSVRGTGSLLLPCSPAALAAAGVGELEVGELAVERVGGGWRIEAPVVQVLAGVRLASERRTLEGQALREAAARLVLDNRIFKGAAARLRDRLHLWAMLSAWLPEDGEPHWTGAKLGPAPEDERAWLVERLGALGLETCDELELLSGDDLVPDLSASGLSDEELASLLADFPRVWVYLGGSFACEVQPRARKVWIEPIDQTAKKAKEPPREVLPRFRGFGVMYRQASRVLKLR